MGKGLGGAKEIKVAGADEGCGGKSLSRPCSRLVRSEEDVSLVSKITELYREEYVEM
jgi:hypothetical protein